LIKDVFPSYDMTFEKYRETFGVSKLIKAYNFYNKKYGK
jgi:hypothetical protein